MFVRTRPKDNARIVITESEADKIDEEWFIVNDTYDSFVAEKENYAKEKEISPRQNPRGEILPWRMQLKKY